VTDDVTRALSQLAGERPTPRLDLPEREKDKLVAQIGPRTVRNIVRAKADYPLRRIPFLFSTVDTQAVVDILANDMEAALERALAGNTGKKRS